MRHRPRTWIHSFAMRISRTLVLMMVTCVSGSAMAASHQSQERTARKACLSGDYDKGVRILSSLFVDTGDTTYIFNQARCFEQNRRYQDAIGRFQEFLRVSKDLTAEERAMTDKHIADCQDLLSTNSVNLPRLRPRRVQQPRPRLLLLRPSPPRKSCHRSRASQSRSRPIRSKRIVFHPWFLQRNQQAPACALPA